MNYLSTKIHCLLPLISFIIISCKNEEIVYPEGGYNYPNQVVDKDTTFYCYPLKDIVAPFDTIKTTETFHLLRLFDEYNLSLKPANTTIFRFTYFNWRNPTVINLTPTEIIVKKINKSKYPLHDTTKLNEKERNDLDNFEFLAEYSNSAYYEKWYKHDFDSLIKLNPRLLNSGYYKELLDKSSEPGNDKLEYSITTISITKKTFIHLVNLINESGYWELPCENICEFVPTDASDFILEANTPNKYKFVISINCPGDITKYTKACQELIYHAKANIRLIWNGAATTDSPVVKPKDNKLRPTKIEYTKPQKKKAK